MKLELVQMHAAGGSKPRHFAFNKAGDLVAVALEDSNTISIIARNVRSGLLTEFMTIQRVADRPNMVLWDELWTFEAWRLHALMNLRETSLLDAIVHWEKVC